MNKNTNNECAPNKNEAERNPQRKEKIQSEPNGDEGDDARQSETGITEATTAITTTTTTITTRMYYMLRNIYLQEEPTITIIMIDANTINTNPNPKKRNNSPKTV